MSNMNYISFIVDGQKLSCNQRHYSSTGTINTLSCSFKFKTNDSEDTSGWDLPYLWTQFHDLGGNTYVKPVNENTCAIPSDCLKQPEFKMTLFATDTHDYMACTKRYTTNEVTFRFNGDANLDYDGGVDPDEPLPSHWQILVDIVNECENRVDAFDGRITANENDIEDLNTRLDSKADVEDIPDLTGYVKNTDYATNSVGGVIKVDSQYALAMYNGKIYPLVRTYQQYTSDGNNIVITKQTLENVITGKNLNPTITLTQAEYGALETKDENTYYYIPEEE